MISYFAPALLNKSLQNGEVDSRQFIGIDLEVWAAQFLAELPGAPPEISQRVARARADSVLPVSLTGTVTPALREVCYQALLQQPSLDPIIVQRSYGAVTLRFVLSNRMLQRRVPRVPSILHTATQMEDMLHYTYTITCDEPASFAGEDPQPANSALFAPLARFVNGAQNFSAVADAWNTQPIVAEQPAARGAKARCCREW